MSLTSKIKALLTYANGVTSKEDETLGDAVKSLADGYGQGGGDDVLISILDRSIKGEYSVPKGITDIGAYALTNCAGITKLILPEGLTKINSNAMSGMTSLVNVTFPSTLTYIGDYSFQGNVRLQTLDIPANVVYIGVSAFYNSWNKRTIICRAQEPPSLAINCFVVSQVANVYVPADSVDAYKAATNWSALADLISAIEE